MCHLSTSETKKQIMYYTLIMQTNIVFFKVKGLNIN